MRDVHFGVHPAFGYIWLLINFYEYLIANRPGTELVLILLMNTMKTDMQLWEFLWQLSFSEKQNRRMIIGLFAEIIKLNENKKSDFKRVKIELTRFLK